MRDLNSSKLLLHRKIMLGKHGSKWRELCKGSMLALCCFLLSGARLFGQPLPLAACVVAALPIGLSPLLATFGAVLGYFLRCEAALAAEYSAVALLMLVAVVVFQGTSLPAFRWFMPTMAACVCAIFGSIGVLGGGLQISLLLTKVLLAFVATAAFQMALAGKRTAILLLAATLLSGLSGFSASFDLGVLFACALCVASGEISIAAAAGLALDLTGKYGQCAMPALVLPALLCRLLHSKDRKLSVATYAILPSVVFFCFDRLSVGLFAANLVGSALGFVIKRSAVPIFSRVHDNANDRLQAAASVLEMLCRHLPEEALSTCADEAEEIYDAAAERVCRCCPRFHRCWEHYALQTYEALLSVSHRIIERGVAEAEDFPQSFREHCCHLEGFVVALNQELEGMLYRRRYRMQLRESRQVVAQELCCIAEYLRTMQNEPVAIAETRSFSPQVGVCALGKNGSRVSGDRGAYFAGANGVFYVLLCDGMGTGAAAAASSCQTVRLLKSLLHSGLAPQAALKILNGTELLRGTGCYTTVDLLSVDLNTGTAKLYKWGSAPSYLRDFDEIKKLGTADTPPGVSIDDSAQEYGFSFKHGQMLVLLTDGADALQVEATLASYCGTSSRELAALLVAAAHSEDDMSAVVVSLCQKNVKILPHWWED